MSPLPRPRLTLGIVCDGRWRPLLDQPARVAPAVIIQVATALGIIKQ
jgi:hypothetical protein